MLRIAVIGFGAMARSVAALLASGEPSIVIGAALTRAGKLHALSDGMARFTSVPALLDWQPDLVAECASHEAVEEHVPQVLAAGVSVVVASVGALAGAGILDRLEQAAKAGGSRIILPAGAVGGLDALAAARVAGLDHVRYVGRKPPLAWKQSPAENRTDLDRCNRETVIFEGDAATAARLFPKNANVTAAVALAGMGFAATDVTLIADPAASGNVHEIEAEGTFGRLRITLENRPLPDNPKTSRLAALSIARAVRNHAASLVI